MNRAPHTCMGGCGKIITWRFALCSDCELKYGRSALRWPTWLRDLWNEEQRWRRRHKKYVKNEVTFTDLFEETEDVDEHIYQ
jgi:hypothetical protein